MLTVRGAELVWTGAEELPGGEVDCGADGRVSAVAVDGEVLDASGCVVTPGLINAHHHLLQTAFRTLPGTKGIPMRDWLPRIPVPLEWRVEIEDLMMGPPAPAEYGRWTDARLVVDVINQQQTKDEKQPIRRESVLNIGAPIGAGSKVDTWATVGSCAQIGRAVHISGGVGIGGVLEPPSARPVIVEDGAFIGSRCILVEGVLIEEGAVLGATTTITASTPIYDVTGPEPVEHRGRVPARSVVIPGTRPREFPAGTYQLPCALIIGRRSETTDRKTSLICLHFEIYQFII